MHTLVVARSGKSQQLCGRQEQGFVNRECVKFEYTMKVSYCVVGPVASMHSLRLLSILSTHSNSKHTSLIIDRFDNHITYSKDADRGGEGEYIHPIILVDGLYYNPSIFQGQNDTVLYVQKIRQLYH